MSEDTVSVSPVSTLSMFISPILTGRPSSAVSPPERHLKACPRVAGVILA